MPSPRPALIVVHKVLIASAAGLGLLMAVWSFARYLKRGEAISVAIAAASLVIAVVLALYYRTIDRRHGG